MSRRRWGRRAAWVVVWAWAGAGASAAGLSGQEIGRPGAESLGFPELSFDPPEPEVHEVRGVTVLLLEDHALPLVSVYARFQGGYGRFERSHYGAATALPSLLRYGGTASLPPDSVDERLEYYAFQTSFGSGGGTIFAGLNTLSEHLATGMQLWGEMLQSPRFDSTQVEIWRGRTLEAIRRRPDNPSRLAFSEFNRLLYGDHPIGWEMEPGDLDPEDLARDRLEEVHGRILCPANLIMGVTGDVTWEEVRPLLDDMLAGWPACGEPLPEAPEPDIRREPGVFLIERELEQSVIVMAHPTDVHMADDPEYFAAQIGNSILGGGGFSSRILSRVRTEEGYAYSASSLWTTPREHEGIVGAITRTRPENTVPAIRLILDIMDEIRAGGPAEEEVGTAVDRIVNGFVFNFETPGQIVSRQMFYRAQELPLDWLERYLDGVQRVTPEGVRRVFEAHLRPEAMTILVLGDPQRIGREALESLGPVTEWEVEEGR